MRAAPKVQNVGADGRDQQVRESRVLACAEDQHRFDAPDKAGRCSLLSLVRRNFSGIVCCVVNLSDVLAQAGLRDFLITPDEVEDPAAMDFDVHHVFAISVPTWKLGKHIAKFTARTKAAQVLVLCWLLCHCCNVFGLNWAGSSHFRVR